MLVQLHWHNPDNLDETEFVAQYEITENTFESQRKFEAWLGELCARRGSECPAGWGPLVCTEDAPMFVKAVL